MATIELRDLVKSFGGSNVVDEISLQIEAGEFLTLLGPSGCGKTTTLRMIAGFEQPTSGQIFLAGEPVAGVPAYRRNVNTVFQNYALFPHLTVGGNIEFGLKRQRVPQPARARRVADAVDMVQLAGLEDRLPTELSGGQQQRVALARALVNRPKVLLLDEPLGALDLKLRRAMQLELKALQRSVGITFIYVTHDQEEAMTMSDRVAVMKSGKLLQVGSVQDIYDRPTSRFVAGFIGEINFLTGVEVARSGHKAEISVAGVGTFTGYAREASPNGAPVTLAVRPERIRLSRESVGDNAVPVTIRNVVFRGSDLVLEATLANGGSMVAHHSRDQASSLPQPAIGESMFFTWRTDGSTILVE